MRLRLLLFACLASLLVTGGIPESASAKRKTPASKTKKKAKGKQKAPPAGDKDAPAADPSDLDEDPWADDEQPEKAEAEEDDAADDEPDQDDGEEGQPAAAGDGAADTGGFQRSGRMEFDERLVKGQAAKSGAVYLFKRMPRRLPGLVPMRSSYRRRIVAPVLGERELKPAVYSAAPTAEDRGEEQPEIPPAPDGEAGAKKEPEPDKDDDEDDEAKAASGGTKK